MGDRLVPAAPRSGAGIDAIAYTFIEKTQPGVLVQPAPFDVEEFFEFDLEAMTRVITSYQRLPAGIYGLTDSEKMISIVDVELFDKRRKGEVRFCRSTIAHECGHAILHVPEFRRKRALLKSIQDKSEVAMKMYRREQVPVYMDPEWQANRFAGALLLPEKTLKRVFKETQDIKEIAEVFDVNPAFVRSRLRAIGIKKRSAGTPLFSI